MLLREYRGKAMPFTIGGERKLLSYITWVDPLSGRISKISEERTKRGIGISVSLDIVPQESCTFCSLYESTPKERIEHASGAVSVPNAYPWEKYDWVTIYPPFGRHKFLLSDLYFDDLERMIESSYDLAKICSQDPEVLAFMDFTNWGPFAGASQQHPHSQRKSITFLLDSLEERERKRCRELARRHGRNPFDMLMEEEMRDGRRVIYNDDIFVASAFAPTCPDEVIAFPKHNVAHILQTNAADRKRMIGPILGVFPALFFYRGLTDLNIAVHMAPFAEMEAARRYFRWHMHIYPRRPRLPSDRAGAEIGFGTNVIDVLPERSAELLRSWYEGGPQEKLVAHRPDGSPNEKLLEQFHKLTLKCP